MAKLIFLLDGNVIKEYALDKERMTIGRRATNDIHIDNLAISGEHAELVVTGEDVFLQDLNSTNGTLVNQKPVKKQVLNHGDTIGLGKYQLKYLKEAGFSKPASDGFADTVLVQEEVSAPVQEDVSDVAPESNASAIEADAQVEQSQDDVQDEPAEDERTVEETSEDDKPALTPASEESESPAAEVQASAEPVEPQEPQKPVVNNPRLQILNGENEGSALLLDKSMVKVGQPGTQVAVVTKRQHGYYLTHVAGNKFPMVNGQSIGAQAYALNNHDEIEVLGVKMEFCLD